MSTDYLFPNRITLNGVDYFLLQLDRLMWQSSGKRNVCTFVVELPKPLTLAELQQQLTQRPAYQWLCRLRLRQGLPFSLAKWVYQPNAELPPINEYSLATEAALANNLLSTSLDINRQSAFKIDLLHRANGGSVLIFTWHHALMDARGGEAFIHYLGLAELTQPEWLAEAKTKLPLKVRADIASAMKQFLYDTSRLPLLSLYQKTTVKPQTCYKVLAFSTEQTQRIHQQAKQHDAGFLVSAFYLAATTYAVTQVQKQRGRIEGDVLVPVPLDQRKRGKPGVVLSNQVSFLFYRIPNAVLNDVPACTAALIDQMKTLMRNDNPAHYTIMLDFLRRLPSFFYRMMLKAPTKGLMASFFYSDTGDSLPNIAELFGQTVRSAIHYPPNTYPPGVTFIFSRYQGALQVTLGYMVPGLNADEVESLLRHLQTVLLGAEND